MGTAPIKPPVVASFPISGAQLKEIFPSTVQSRCDEVAEIINKYSTEYGIDNAEKMSHFIGQIGAETLLTFLSEITYSENNIKNSSFAKTTRSYEGKKVLKYCDLFEGYESVSTDKCPFPYCTPPLYQGTSELTVKDKYVKSLAFFDYVYACRMGNGNIDSKDGSRFRGRGFLQLTGYGNYKQKVQEVWDKLHGKGNKDFLCRSEECDKNLDMIATDLDLSMQTAMTFWKAINANEMAKDVEDDTIKDISIAINGGTNGIKHRTNYTKKSYEILNK